MGLGSATIVSLADARERAATERREIAQEVNPIDERKHDGGIPTFGEMADDVRETLSADFRNAKHRAQWKSTLETYAAPLRARAVDAVATHVLAVLRPIWMTKAETRVVAAEKPRHRHTVGVLDGVALRILPDQGPGRLEMAG
jgi:hypothetical protein